MSKPIASNDGCNCAAALALKIGAVITRNTRRVRFLLSSAYPYRRLFADIATRLHPT